MCSVRRTIISSVWYIFFALVNLTGAQAWGISQALTPATIEPGQRATLVVRLKESELIEPVPEEGDAYPNCFDDLLVRSPNYVILDRDYKRERGEFVWRYELTVYKPGVVALPPLEVRWGPQTFSTTSERLTVTTTRADSDEALRPDYGRVPRPWPWRWVLLAFALTIATLLARDYLRRRRRAEPVPLGPPPPTDVEWLRARLQELRAELAEHARAELVDRLTAIVREFLERRRRRPVRAWTRREMLTHLPEAKLRALWSFWARYDAFQFSSAKEAPGPLVEDGIREVEAILDGEER